MTENGDLADLNFVVPKMLRNPQALSFICGEGEGKYVEPQVFAAVKKEAEIPLSTSQAVWTWTWPGASWAW